jgi:hypothetical protein
MVVWGALVDRDALCAALGQGMEGLAMSVAVFCISLFWAFVDLLPRHVEIPPPTVGSLSCWQPLVTSKFVRLLA